MNLFSVKDKTILITGASRGIGKAYALGFQEGGATVYGTGTSDGSISWMKDMGIEGRVNNSLEYDRIPEIINEIKSKHGKLDVLINTAGIAMNRPASMISEQEMQNIIEVNFKSVVRSSQAYYKTHKNIGGNIINISSVLGLRGFALSSVYSGTKGAIIQLTKACVAEWTRHKFRLNVICPGFIDTDMNRGMKENAIIMDSLQKKIPMGRVGKPEELVGTAVFLASEASAYLTGQILVLDGGMTEVMS